ncbi:MULTISPECIES: ABC transporter permease [unclassified Parafrankia]|uniref:ABC transporter permease n=1 Tax=unclassified Parafrankia TaxID=2994368 RepID=UPI000DA4FF77|nr:MULTISPECIES: ABC transporter permease [unclassified Parafrankia]TCJ33452.1 ABC transporter permease [Parafrankia sp. BMG5.11]SQD94159.1 putative ABC transporter transmembrane protein [Parafrankia sp. Ea1.12]
MTTITETRPVPATPSRTAGSGQKVTGRRVLRSEWAKLWSLQSTWITLTLGLLFLFAVGIIAAVQYRSMTGPGKHLDPGLADATTQSLALFGVPFALVALGVLGVLTTSGEYTSGMIRSTLAAVPRRLPVLWAKAAVHGLIAFVLSVIGVFVAFLVASGILSRTPIAMSVTDGGVVRSLLGAGLYLGLVAVIGVALGALLRSTAGGISALVGTFLLVPSLMSLLPRSWRTDVTPYLPSSAGESVFALHHTAGTLSAGAGLLVLLGWTALVLGGAAHRLVRSDV